MTNSRGAKDDGAGVSTLLEIARIVSGATDLRNDIVFAGPNVMFETSPGKETGFVARPPTVGICRHAYLGAGLRRSHGHAGRPVTSTPARIE